MNIAICDDNEKLSHELKILVENYFDNNNHDFVCDTYLSGEALLDRVDNHNKRYHIYLLDIEMGETNGLETARLIRKNDMNAVIMFITNYSDKMQEAFDVLTFRYLLKPVNQEKLEMALKEAIDYLQVKRKIFRFHIRKTKYTLYFEDIKYFESRDRKVIIYLEHTSYEYYGSLKEVLERTDQDLFVQIHHSRIVNLDYVHMLKGKDLTMKTGEVFPITPKYHSSFNEAYKRYVRERIR